MITPIPSYYVSVVWPKVAHLIRPAIEYVDSGFTEADIYGKILVSDMQLWVVGDYQAAAVTQIILYPRHKTCLVVALGGDGIEEWFDELMGTIEDWSKEMGCTYVEEFGRKGWERVGSERGYERIYTVMRKTVGATL